MAFGLWVEPEMVNPDSHLYRKHPNWVMHFKGRPRTELPAPDGPQSRAQRREQYVYSVLDKLASEYDIHYLKWDYNRNLSDPGWPEVAPDQQRKLCVKYVHNLYDIFDRLRAKHPRSRSNRARAAAAGWISASWAG